MTEQFAKDVDDGLSKNNKTLPSKYFYNQRGDELFVEIMNLPEYYLTRAEMEVLSKQTQQVVEAFGVDSFVPFDLIELGAGDGSKTIKILEFLTAHQYQFDYVPVDISKNILEDLEQSVKNTLPSLSVKQQHGDYFEILESLKFRDCPKIVLFLGSNIGNMMDDAAGSFLKRLSKHLNPGDKLLLGADLIKAADIVLPAYNDEQGVTRDFNMNLLHRMNTELDATFNVDNFEHTPEYDEAEGVARSFITSTENQQVAIHKIGKVYEFKAGERIHTEVSRKYNDDIMNTLIHDTHFSIENKFTDSNDYFADYILSRS